MVVLLQRPLQTAVVVDLSDAVTVPEIMAAVGIMEAALEAETLRGPMVQRRRSLLPAQMGQHQKVHLHQQLFSQTGSLQNEL